MKTLFCFLLLGTIYLFVAFCSKEGPDQEQILARINDFHLSLEEFQSQLTDELELDGDFKLTRNARMDFLESLIRKELLIQEARKLKLERDEKFIRTIERYWESTLVRNLIDLKAAEIASRTYVTQEEIEARYEKIIKGRKDIPPLEEVQTEITAELKEKKKTRMLEEWIKGLRQKAKVEINDTLLEEN